MSRLDNPSGAIPEYSVDPANPSPQDAWVLKSGGGASGGGSIKMSVGMGMIYPAKGSGGAATYQFSYETLENTIKRVTIS